MLSEEDRDYYKILSIVLAVLVGFQNAFQTFYSKTLFRKLKILPTEFIKDASLISAVGTGVLYYNEHPSLMIAHNFLVSFINSTTGAITGIVGLNATVKGLAGPTSAIIYT